MVWTPFSPSLVKLTILVLLYIKRHFKPLNHFLDTFDPKTCSSDIFSSKLILWQFQPFQKSIFRLKPKLFATFTILAQNPKSLQFWSLFGKYIILTPELVLFTLLPPVLRSLPFQPLESCNFRKFWLIGPKSPKFGPLSHKFHF